MTNEQINNLENQIFLLKENYIKTYVLYHNNPSVSEYSNQFFSIEGKLDKLNGDVFIMENNLNSNNEKLKKNLEQVKYKINELKRIIKEHSRELNLIKGNNSAAEQLYANKVINYNSSFTNLIVYLLGSVGMIYFGYKKYKENI
jgi:hypothetical protein